MLDIKFINTHDEGLVDVFDDDKMEKTTYTIEQFFEEYKKLFDIVNNIKSSIRSSDVLRSYENKMIDHIAPGYLYSAIMSALALDMQKFINSYEAKKQSECKEKDADEMAIYILTSINQLKMKEWMEKNHDK